MKTIHFISLVGLLLGACSSIERGVVVAKGHRVKPEATPPIDYYWVDVRGQNREGRRVTERLELFKPDWDRFPKGAVISPHDFEPLGVVKRLAMSLPAPTPGPVAASRKPASKKTPPTRGKKAKESAPTAVVAKKPNEEARYRNAESRANDDPAIRELKLRIHNAKSDDEQAAAWQEYRRALFQKMRGLDPSLKDRIDQAESARGQR